MFVSTYLSDVLRDFRVHTNLDLCEGVDLRTASPGLLLSGYNIVRNSTRLEVCLKVRISNSNARKTSHKKVTGPWPRQPNDMI